MARTPLTAHKQKAYWGFGLILLGLATLASNLAFVAAPLAHVLQTSAHGLAGLLSFAGLSVIQAAGSFALGQVDYLPLASRILLSFFAMVALVVGLALVRSRSLVNGSNSLPSSALSEEETE
jgi:hypothetical protein